ncbi:spheroidin [Betaentomopoxvirus amoorei]|uniref:Spheroidin n=1 Tax=Amsacta moorei entomopoxvirus TaxID=28321 RepID=SPHR_AMEPV|nr:spheroidin [Amsacta moorei entomopoxvirus]P29815.2 RecName: Full=Spheroidin [Amsacta moorei entomopoxvirus]AAA42378.1 spheroidin [unidentified entomopoxvirus]AAA42383.1 spheroidin [unidentified entomopoxvirus]AAG02893.1 AMV187 [Amsacta moorei entomopoxvirus]
MSNVPLATKTIRKLSNRKYEIKIYLKDENTCFERVVDMVVPLYDVCNETSGVTLESCSPNIEVIELDNTHVRIKVHGDTLKEMCFELLFPCNVNEAQVWKYVSRLLLDNVSHNDVKYKLANFRLTLNGKHLKLKEIDQPLFIYFVDDLGNYGLITKENIQNNNLQVNKDASFITIFPQYAYICLGRKVYLNEKVTFDVTTDATNITLDFNKSVNIAVSFLDIYYEVNNNEQKDLLKDLLKRYGEFEVYNADTGLIYAKNLSIKNYDTVIQVERLPVNLKVRAYTKDENGRNLCLMKITSSTEVDPEYVTSNNALLGTLRVYKKFDKSHLKIVMHNRGSGNVFPLRSLYLELSNVKGYPVKASDTSRLDVGIYKLNKIYVDNDENKIILEEIEAEYRCGRQVFHERVKLNKHQCKYTPKCPFQFVVNSPDTTIHLYGISNVCLKPKVPKNLRLWGWILDCDTSRFIKHMADGSDDLDLDVRLNRNDICLKQAIKQHYTNVIILEYANTYPNCTLSLGNNRFNNVFDMNDNKTISEYTNFTKSRQDLNNMSCILGINIGNSVNISSLPGWVTPHEAKILRSGCARVREFCKSFCDLSNKRFYAMARDLVSLLFMCNYVNIEINEAVCEYPGYVILFARAIKVINDLLLINGVDNLAGYSISLPIHYGSTEKTLPNEKYGGVDKKFKYLFLKNKLKDLMRDADFVQPPLYISTYFRTLLDAPPTDNYEKYLVDSSVQSQDVLQGLLNTCNTIDTNARVASSVIGYVYEPCGTSEHKIGSEALCKMAKEASRLGNLGLVNRINESNYNKCNKYGYRGVYENNKLKTKYYREIFDCNPNNNNELISRYGYRIMDLHKIGEIFANYDESESPCERRCHYLEDRGLLYGPEYVHHRYQESCTPNTFGNNTNCVTRNGEQHVYENSCGDNATCGRRTGYGRRSRDEWNDYRKPHVYDNCADANSSSSDSCSDSSSSSESESDSDGCCDTDASLDSDIENCYQNPSKCDAGC